ncbi:MAG TPA: alpha/beta hydrolase [Anaerolineaceae bacterium]
MTIQILENIAFTTVTNSTGAEETLHLDLYLPEDHSQALHSCIIFIHGGGFQTGNDKRQGYIQMLCQTFAEKGVVCVSPDYRVRPDPRPDWKGAVADAAADARAALEWVKANHAAYQIDPQNITLAGGSAGGMTAISLVHDPASPITRTSGVKAVINMWGSPSRKDRLFITVNRHSPPTLIIHGTADQLVPYENSREFAAELAQNGVLVQLLTLPGAPHTPVIQQPQVIISAIEEFLSRV